MAKPPDAFLSYTRFDDEHDGGAISEFCRRLANAVRAVTGAPFDIFQDVGGIGIGEHWPGKLDQMLDQARFFIPIVTPSYFTSKACREELEKFLRAEAKRKRSDLVLPIYYIECDLLEDHELRAADPLARAVHERQRQDWRELRFESFEAREVRKALERLARGIAEARRRAVRQAEDEAWKRPEDVVRRSFSPDRSKVVGVEVKSNLKPGTRAGGVRPGAGAVKAVPGHSLEAPAIARPTAGAGRDQTRRPVVLEPLTDKEVAARVRARVDSKKAEEEARQRAEDNARRLAAEKVRRRSEEQAAIKRQAEEEAPKKAEEDAGRGIDGSALRKGLGKVFRDVEASWCPEMTVILPGEFMMGAPDGESEACDEEKPQHRVRIAHRFAIGRYPVTFAEYDQFCRSTRRQAPGDQGWGRERRPAINLSWDDAMAYAAWLARETGQPYRLPSEAEWEYACRAGTAMRYWWGDKITPANANYGMGVGRTSEVGAYPANPWGLFDMHGNVWEWVEDRWHGTYQGAPDDGSAWLQGADSRRVVRGGAWFSAPGVLRAACRFRDDTANRVHSLGLRVATTLTS